MQKRIGKNESATLNAAIKQIASYKILRQDKARRETFFNHLLYRHLAQVEQNVTNVNIHSATIIGETFRPEFYIKGTSSAPLFCVECKKLTDVTAKARLKEGLSQALVYSNEYKCVLLVFYDYSKSASYNSYFAKSGSSEKKFSDNLWKHHRIKIIFVVPQ